PRSLLCVYLVCSLPHRALRFCPTRRSSDLCQRHQKTEDQKADADRQRGARPQQKLHGVRPAHRKPAAQKKEELPGKRVEVPDAGDRKSTRLNSSHVSISYAVFCLNKKRIHV